MEKIQQIQLYRLSNARYGGFMYGINTLIEDIGEQQLNVEEANAGFRQAFTDYNKAIKAKQGSAFTLEILQLDRQRLQTLGAILGRLRNTLLCPIETEREAASILLYACRKARKVRSQSYAGKSAILRITCEKLLDGENAVRCQQLGIKHWVEALLEENVRFKQKQEERSLESIAKKADTVANARKALDKAYQNIVERINALVCIDFASADAIHFIKMCNTLIKRQKAQQAWRKSMRAGKKRREAQKKG